MKLLQSNQLTQIAPLKLQKKEMELVETGLVGITTCISWNIYIILFHIIGWSKFRQSSM